MVPALLELEQLPEHRGCPVRTGRGTRVQRAFSAGCGSAGTAGVHSALASLGKPTVTASLDQCSPAWSSRIYPSPADQSWQAGRGLSHSCLCRFHPTFQGHCGFESPCLGLIKARPPAGALFFWCISTISHSKLKQKSLSHYPGNHR